MSLRYNLPKPAACFALLLLFLLLTAYGAHHDSVTVDEFAIVPSGLAKLTHFERARWLNPVNPPLVQMALASPLLFTRCEFREEWLQEESPESRWIAGMRFMTWNLDSYLLAFHLARSVSIVFALVLGFFVFQWSRELFGFSGGLTSLALFCFCPNMLAHGHLATVDVGFTTFLFLSSYFQWKWLSEERHRTRHAILFVLSCSCALLSKYTAVLLLPLYLFFLFLPARTWSDHSIRRRLAWKGAAALLLIGLLLVLAINSLYGWEGVGSALGSLELRSGKTEALQSGWAAQLPSPLPKWYLKGADREFERMEGKRNLFFFRGQVSSEKDPVYFLYAFLVKTPLSTLVLIGLAVVISLHRRRWALLPPILPPIVLLALFSFVIGANLGLRYVLPIYPFLYTATGMVGPWQGGGSGRRWLVRTLLGLTAASALLCAPRFVSYFNILAGGSQNGYKHLSDSNVDWGQDLRDLSRVMDERGIAAVYLSYFGLVDPRLYGVRFIPPAKEMEKGVIAVSAHHLNGITPFQTVEPSLLRDLRNSAPIARAGDSLFLFALPQSQSTLRP